MAGAKIIYQAKVKASTTIQYEFNPDFTLRISAITDTFEIKNEDLTTSFEDWPVDGQGLSAEANRLDGLNISLCFRTKKSAVIIIKIIVP